MSKLLLAFIGIFIWMTGAVQAQNETEVPTPTQAQMDWQNAELVAVFHYDLHVFDGKAYNQRENRVTPVPDYNIFNPEKLDTDQWIKSAKDAGCEIAIITATHETGFALYQSDVNPYSLKALKWRDGKGDIVKDFVTSCHKYGVKPGIYIGIRWNSFYGIYDFMVNGNNDFAENRQQYYNRMAEGMVDELMSRYGDLAIVWFDGGAHGPELGGPDVLSIFEKYQSNCIFYHNSQRADIRWGGSETGTVPYPSWGTYPFPYSHSTNQGVIFANNFHLLKEGDPDGKYYMPAMSDAPLRGYNGGHDWFWEPKREHTVYPLVDLVEMYYKSVGRNTSLIIGLTPDPDGLMPDADVQRLKEFGEEIERRFSNPVGANSGIGNELTINFQQKETIKKVVIQEDLSHGERVRKFLLEGKSKDGWQLIFEGSCIGHKFIHQFDNMEVDEVKLRILESRGEPQIKTFEVYNIE